jgi:hypothetical protein
VHGQTLRDGVDRGSANVQGVQPLTLLPCFAAEHPRLGVDGLSCPVMGLLTEFFIASADQAAKLAEDGPQDASVPAVFGKDVDTVKIATLNRLIIDPAGELRLDIDEPVNVDQPDGPWLFVMRDEVTAAIGGLADDQISAAAQNWAATEEWLRDLGDSANLAPFLGDLRDLARRADPPVLRLYHWICL